MVPDWPTTISAAGVIIAGIAVGYALNGIRKSHNFKKEADRKRKANDSEGAKESLKRAIEELDLANLIPPMAFRSLVVGIGAQVVAAIWIILSIF